MMRGYSLIQIVFVCAIVALLATAGVVQFSRAKKDKAITTLRDGIVFTLEEAKANAVAGKYGDAHGVHVASTSYAYFVGSTYDVNDSYTKQYQGIDGFVLSVSLSGGGSDVVFARRSGEVSAYGDITVTDESDNSRTRVVHIGASGDVSVVE